MLSAIRTTIGTIGHEDRLTTVGHLDELRTRLIVSLVAIGVAFGFCFWQNHRLLAADQPPAGPSDPGAGSSRPRAARRDVHGRAGRARSRGAAAAVVGVLDGPGQHPTPAAKTALDGEWR